MFFLFFPKREEKQKKMLDSFEYQGRTVRDRETKTSKKQKKKVGKHCLNEKNNFFYLITFVHFRIFSFCFWRKFLSGKKNIDNHWLYSFQMIKYVWNKNRGLFKQPKGNTHHRYFTKKFIKNHNDDDDEGMQ